MALRDLREDIIEHFKENASFLDHNNELYEIFEGDLLPRVLAVLQATLSPQYYEKIKKRVLPINILKRYVDKVSKVYSKPPRRIAVTDNAKSAEIDQILIDYWVEKADLDSKMNFADEYWNMFKGFAVEPGIKTSTIDGENIPKIKVFPYDRFLPYGDNIEDKQEMTVFVKIMGKQMIPNSKGELEQKTIFYTYSENEFDAFDSSGDTYEPAFKNFREGDLTNPYMTIPQVYSGNSRTELIPKIDTDLLEMTTVIPTIFSDLSGVSMFQCFTIMYGIDVDAQNLTMSPNAFWEFKSNPQSDKTPQLGQLEPKADIDKVLNFIFSIFTTWLETKGIRVGNIGSMDANNASASGISKIIDEMDTFEIRKVNIKHFKNVEKVLWMDKIKKIHNYYVDAGLIEGMPKFSDDFKISIEFDEPKPLVDSTKILDEEIKKLENLLTTRERAIRRVNPDISQEEIDDILNSETTININEGV